MTCYTNCLHCDVCKCADEVEYKDCETMKADCPHFKNKTDFVEVVRCKDCGMSRETEDERYLFCMQFADTVDCQAFCSYGQRK